MDRIKSPSKDAIQKLAKLKQAATAERYPNVPEYALPRAKLNTSTANGLTKSIIQWLELNGHYAVRINTQGRYLHKPGKWIPGTTRRGTADIHAVINGRHVSIEVKVGRDKMSEAQHNTKAAIEQAGGTYFIAKDFDSFMTWYNEIK
jgi:hypothetical protein